MKLTRRDALVVLGGVGVVAESGSATFSREEVAVERVPALPSLVAALETLVGLENPPGHPGETESYQRGPR